VKHDIIKQNIIIQALDSYEGRKSLADAMVAPISNAICYPKLLLIDELPKPRFHCHYPEYLKHEKTKI